jgi:thiol-disulfide isomerase/thioredoxin
MGTRDRLKKLGKRILGIGAPTAAPPPPPVAPAAPSAPIQPTGSLASLGDLWAVRYAIEANGRPIVVNHWATWCEGCVEEIGHLVALHQRWGAKAKFVGIGWELFSSAEPPAGAVRVVDALSRELGVAWPTVVFDGPPHELFAGLELAEQHIPQTFVLDGDGAVRFHHPNVLSSLEVARIDEVLAALARE